MKRYFLLLFLTLINCDYIIAQTTVADVQPPTIIPPTPEAATLGAYYQLGAPTSSGLPNINIPISSISSGQVSTTINMSYNAQGIQADQIASSVGLGWTLSYGGVVTRQVRTLRDELTYFQNGANYSTNNLSIEFEQMGTDSPIYQHLWTAASNGNPLGEDMDPDIFTYSFMGNSGNFFLHQETQEVILSKKADIDVEIIWEGGLIAGYIITDSSGNKAHFGDTNNTIANNLTDLRTISPQVVKDNELGVTPLSPISGTVSTWYLQKIVDYNGHEINFEYITVDNNYKSIRPSSIQGSSRVAGWDDNSAKEMLISKVYSDKDEVEFSYSGRLDHQNGKKVEKITLKRNAIVYKEYDLDYDYYTSLDDTPTYYSGANPYNQKRLRLRSIKEKYGVTELPPYTFNYSHDQIFCVGSTKRDAWGYYNGANNDDYLVKKNNSNNVDLQLVMNGAARGLLNEIIFPTGGSKRFVYEQNRCLKPLGYSNSALSVVPSQDMTLTNVQLTKLGGQQYIVSNNSGILVYEKQFEVVNPFTHFGMHVEITNSDCGSNSTCDYQISIIGPNGFSRSFLYGDEYTIADFPEGNYKIKVKTWGEELPDDPYRVGEHSNFIVNVSWYKNNAPVNDPLSNDTYVGGVRVKEIILNDGHQDVIKNVFEYKDDDGTSSGRVLSFPLLRAMRDVNGIWLALTQAHTDFHAPMGNYSGSSITYTKVKEEQIDLLESNSNGYSLYEFSYYNPSNSYYDWPFLFPTDAAFANGDLISKKVYQNRNGENHLVYSIENTYSSPCENYLPTLEYPEGVQVPNNSCITHQLGGLLTSNYVDHIVGTMPNQMPVPLRFFPAFYSIQSLNWQLTQTSEKFYNQAGDITAETIKEYGYDSDNHYQMTSSKVTDSSNKEVLNEFVYPPDLSNENYMNDLTTANRISDPIVSTYTYGGFETQKVNKTYALFGGVPRVSKVEVVKEGEALVAFEITQYDSEGNIQEIKDRLNRRSVYLWGYDSKLPVMKIDRTSLNEVPQALRDNLANATSETAVGSYAQQIRGALSDKMITTFVYDEETYQLNKIIDSNQIETTYEYDDFQRLSQIKIKEGSDRYILSKYLYHYQNN